MARRPPPGPDLSSSPLQECPCGSGDKLIKLARKPDQLCQGCFTRYCADRRWSDTYKRWLCHYCRREHHADVQPPRQEPQERLL